MNQTNFDPAFWWYQDGDETRGPVNEAELRRLAAARQVQPDTLVWREDYGDEWRSLEASGLFVGASSPAGPAVSDSWKKVFARIEAAEKPSHADVWGGPKRTQYPFSVLGFLFGPLFYLYLRMWHKALAMILFGLVLSFVGDVVNLIYPIPAILKILGVVTNAICGRYVKNDYYRFRVHGETMWPWKPFAPLQSIYVSLATAAAVLIAVLLLPDDATGQANVLADLSGVWTTPGLTVAIDLDRAQPRIIVNDRPVNVAVKRADASAGVVVLSPSTKPNDLVTLRKVWSDEQHKSFRIALDLDGRSTTLGYLRPMNIDEKTPSPQTASMNAAPSGITFTRNGRVIATGPVRRRATDVAENDAGISGSYCVVGKNILEGQTFNFRAQNIPVDSALDAVADENNFEYKMFMMETIRDLYKDPDAIRESLNNGAWMKACVSAVRGF